MFSNTYKMLMNFVAEYRECYLFAGPLKRYIFAPNLGKGIKERKRYKQLDVFGVEFRFPLDNIFN